MDVWQIRLRLACSENMRLFVVTLSTCQAGKHHSQISMQTRPVF